LLLKQSSVDWLLFLYHHDRSSLLDSHTLVQQARAAGVVEDISPPLVGGASVSSSSYSQEASYGLGGGLAGAEVVGLAEGQLGGASYSSSSYESSLGGAGGVGYDAGLVGGVGGGYGESSYESSSYSSSAGGAGGAVGGLSGGAAAAGIDVGAATFNSADTNRDGRLDSAEFNKFVQGGL